MPQASSDLTTCIHNTGATSRHQQRSNVSTQSNCFFIMPTLPGSEERPSSHSTETLDENDAKIVGVDEDQKTRRRNVCLQAHRRER